jgi:hypothetical protein
VTNFLPLLLTIFESVCLSVCFVSLSVCLLSLKSRTECEQLLNGARFATTFSADAAPLERKKTKSGLKPVF